MAEDKAEAHIAVVEEDKYRVFEELCTIIIFARVLVRYQKISCTPCLYIKHTRCHRILSMWYFFFHAALAKMVRSIVLARLRMWYKVQMALDCTVVYHSTRYLAPNLGHWVCAGFSLHWSVLVTINHLSLQNYHH